MGCSCRETSLIGIAVMKKHSQGASFPCHHPPTPTSCWLSSLARESSVPMGIFQRHSTSATWHRLGPLKSQLSSDQVCPSVTILRPVEFQRGSVICSSPPLATACRLCHPSLPTTNPHPAMETRLSSKHHPHTRKVLPQATAPTLKNPSSLPYTHPPALLVKGRGLQTREMKRKKKASFKQKGHVWQWSNTFQAHPAVTAA